LGGINGGDGIIPGRWTRRGDTVGELVFRAEEVKKVRLKKAEVNNDILVLRAINTSNS
jgi:23S rRNA maturation-related 3'-5' exoribonuclease YhaM